MDFTRNSHVTREDHYLIIWEIQLFCVGGVDIVSWSVILVCFVWFILAVVVRDGEQVSVSCILEEDGDCLEAKKLREDVLGLSYDLSVCPSLHELHAEVGNICYCLLSLQSCNFQRKVLGAHLHQLSQDLDHQEVICVPARDYLRPVAEPVPRALTCSRRGIVILRRRAGCPSASACHWFRLLFVILLCGFLFGVSYL